MTKDAIRLLRLRSKTSRLDAYGIYPTVKEGVRRLRTSERQRLTTAIRDVTVTNARRLSTSDASALAKLVVALFPDSRDVLLQMLTGDPNRPNSQLQAAVLAYLNQLGERRSGALFLKKLGPRLIQLLSSTNDQEVADRIASHVAASVDQAGFVQLARIAQKATTATGRRAALYGLTRRFAMMAAPRRTQLVALVRHVSRHDSNPRVRTYAKRLLSQMARAIEISGKRGYCCMRFRDSVENEHFIHSDSEPDETEWFMREWLHVYYCPFCGTLVKGRGYGDYHRKPFPK